MVSAPDRKGRRALAALAELARGSARPPTPAQLDSGLAAVRSRVDGQRGARRAASRWPVMGVLAGASAIAVVLLLFLGSGSPTAPTARALAYQIQGGSLVDGGYLRESGRAGIRLLFAEGTEFNLMPGTRSRLRSVDGSGARIAIEHGTASFQVTPTPAGERRWQVDVGPFLVTVKGTVFTVSWDAASAKFELRLRHGRVTVSGPLTGEMALRAGQRLVVDLPRGQTVISDQTAQEWDGAPASSAPGPSGGAVPPPERPVPSGAPARSSDGTKVQAVRLKSDRRWAEALAAGRLDEILGEAERAGIKATLEKASGEDLLALADAARYRRRMDLARDTLLAARERFPDSPRSLDAAFLLGRVHEASDRGMARAIEWYDAYLRRAPTGTYASEALGRKMTLTSKLEGVAGARPIAEEYLRRFPSGIYAGSARAFLRAP